MGDDGIVKLQITLDGADLTRAEAPALADGTPYLLFANSTDRLKKAVQIISGVGDNKETVSLAALTSTGAFLQEIPSTATKLYFVANSSITGMEIPPVGDNLSGIPDYVISLNKQVDNAGDVDNVSLYGSGDVISAETISKMFKNTVNQTITVFFLFRRMAK